MITSLRSQVQIEPVKYDCSMIHSAKNTQSMIQSSKNDRNYQNKCLRWFVNLGI